MVSVYNLATMTVLIAPVIYMIGLSLKFHTKNENWFLIMQNTNQTSILQQTKHCFKNCQISQISLTDFSHIGAHSCWNLTFSGGNLHLVYGLQQLVTRPFVTGFNWWFTSFLTGKIGQDTDLRLIYKRSTFLHS